MQPFNLVGLEVDLSAVADDSLPDAILERARHIFQAHRIGFLAWFPERGDFEVVVGYLASKSFAASMVTMMLAPCRLGPLGG